MEKPTPTVTQSLIHALYAHACEQQELILLLSRSQLSLVEALKERDGQFESVYKKHKEEWDRDEGLRGAQARIAAMKAALSVIRESFGFSESGEVA